MNLDRGLRLLCLDGGGIRGLSELIILKAIMDRVQNLLKVDGPLLPADYFDMIGGTSTGGLIAIMLGRLRMNVDEAIEAYEQLSRTIFGTKRSRLRDGKYSEKTFEAVIKSVVARKLGDENAKMLQKEETSCKSFVCAVAARIIHHVRLFRSYQSPGVNEYECTIVEASRATCAAPTYFERVTIGPMQEEFFDGGLGCNNPIKELHQEAEAVFDLDTYVSCILSLGTGARNPIEVKRPTGLFGRLIPTDVINGFKKMALSSEQYALDMERKYADIDGLYFRLNVEHGLANVKLADYEDLGLVQSRTLDYLQSPGIARKLQAIAEALVGRPAHHQEEVQYTLAHLSMSTKKAVDAVHNASAKSSVYGKFEAVSQPTLVENSSDLVQSWLSLDKANIASATDDQEFYLAKRYHNPDLQYFSGSWLLATEEWSAFDRSHVKSIFWLYGPPGCGKSVLTAGIVNTLETRSDESKEVVLYHYCRRDPQATTSMDIVRSLLKQAVSIASVQTLDYLYQLSAKKQSLRNGDYETEKYLWTALQNIIENYEHKVYLVMDAIDELNSNASSLGKLLSLLKSSQTAEPMSLILSSRYNYDTIEAIKELKEIEYFQLEIKGENLQKDLREFVTFRVNDKNSPLRRKPQKTRDDIVNRICQQAQPSFLYATLVLDELKDERKVSSPAAISNILRNLPPKLYSIFEQHLDIPKQSEKGKEVFQWITCATRAMTWDELRCALAMEDGTIDDENIIDDTCDIFVGHSCGELVEVFGNDRDKLRFIHSTVKEMLLSEQGPGNSLGIPDAHQTIVLKLLSYLQNQDLPEFHLELPFEINRESVVEYVQEPSHAIYPYAVLNWFSHLAQCGDNLQEEVEMQLCNFLGSPACVSWLKGALFMSKWFENTRDSTALTTDVVESLNKWVETRKPTEDVATVMFVKKWLRDFLGLMQDWGRVLEYSPFWIHCIPRQFLDHSSCFREALQLQSLQKVIHLENKPLITRRSDPTPWQRNCFSIDKQHDLAYTWDQTSRNLSCYHRGTGLLAAKIRLESESVDLRSFELVLGTQCPQNRFMALLFRDQLTSRQEPSIYQQIRNGLQPTIQLFEDDRLAWVIQNEITLAELHLIPYTLGVSDVTFIAVILELNHDGFMRTNLFGYPTWSLESICAVDVQWVRWEIDDNNILAFSPDSKFLATPSKIVRLDTGATEVPMALGRARSITGGVMTKDFSSVVVVRSSNLLQVLKYSSSSDILTRTASHEFSGIIHILGVSDSGRFSLLLQVQKHFKTDPEKPGRRDKFLQDLCIGIFDMKKVQWTPLIRATPPVTRKLVAWDFKYHYLFTKFGPESRKVFDADKVVFPSPRGWKLSENVRRAPNLSLDQWLEHKYILAFESEKLKDGFGLHPTLVFASSINQFPFEIPTIEYADFVLRGCQQEAQISPSNAQPRRSKDYNDHQQTETAFSRTLEDEQASTRIFNAELSTSRIVISSASSSDIYQIELQQIQELEIERSTLDQRILSDRDPSESTYLITVIRNQPIAGIHEKHSLQFEATYVRDKYLGSQSVVINERCLTIDTLPVYYASHGSSHQDYENTAMTDLLSDLVESFVVTCQPFRDESSSHLADENDLPTYTIFSNDNIEVRGYENSSASVPKLGSNKRSFVLSDATPISSGRFIAQFSSRINMPKSTQQHMEADQYEIFICVFDSSRTITWFVHTTSGGEIRDSGSCFPKAIWALHPTQPLLFWTVPGHAIRVSRIDSNLNPINVCDSVMIEHAGSETFKFSPSGRFVSLLTHWTFKLDIIASPTKQPKPKCLVVLDLLEGISTVLKLPANLTVSHDLDDTRLRIYQLTEMGAVQADSFLLDDPITFQREILTFLPDYCCCTSCCQPLSNSCHISVTEHIGVKTVILCHSPIAIGYGTITGKTCEPLIITVASPEISVQLSSTEDSLVISRTAKRFPPIISQSGTCSTDSHAPPSILTLRDSILPRYLESFDANQILEVPQMLRRMTDFVGSDGTKLATSAIKKFWQDDYKRSIEDLTFLDEFAKSLRNNDKMAKMNEAYGDDIFPKSWEEFQEINAEMEASNDPTWKQYLDTMFKDGGLGCNIPLYTHTFLLCHSSDGSQCYNTWSSAVDVGWIEEKSEWFMRRVICNDFKDARMWYIYTSYDGLSNSPYAQMSKRGEAYAKKQKPEKVASSLKKGKALIPLSSFGEFAEDDDLEGVEDFGGPLRELIQDMNDLIPGGGKIFEVRLQQFLSQSLMGKSMLAIE